MRRLLFARPYADLDFLESRRLEPAVQIARFNPEPQIAVELARIFKSMLEQVQNHDLTAGPQNLSCAADRSRGTPRMMKRLAEHRQIDAALGDGRRFQIAEPKLQIFQPILPR